MRYLAPVALYMCLYVVACEPPARESQPWTRTVATFSEWCESLPSIERAAPGIKVDTDRVAASLVNEWNSIILQNSAEPLGAEVDSPVMQELYAEQIVGAFVAGDTVHFMLTLAVPAEIHPGATTRTENLVRSYANRLEAVREGQAVGDSTTRCLLRGLDEFYAHLMIWADDDGPIRIDLGRSESDSPIADDTEPPPAAPSDGEMDRAPFRGDGTETAEVDLREVILTATTAVVTAGICAQQFGEVPNLVRAVTAYVQRNNEFLQAAIGEIQNTEGWSPAAEEVLQADAMTRVQSLLGPTPRSACVALPGHLDAGDFDVVE
jgi:hypothetical protein